MGLMSTPPSPYLVKKPTPKSSILLPGTRYQTAVELAVVIKRNHAQARAGVGEGELFVGEFGSAGFDGGGEGVEGRGQVDGFGR